MGTFKAYYIVHQILLLKAHLRRARQGIMHKMWFNNYKEIVGFLAFFLNGVDNLG